MKKFFLSGMGVIFFIAIALIAYGTYLNQKGEYQISKRLDERAIPLMGEKIEKRSIKPLITLETLNLYSPEKTDAVALIDGRVEEIVANKNDTVASGQVIVNIVNEKLPIKIKQARSNILKAETELKRSLATYNRYSRLRAYDAATAEQYDSAAASYASAQAGLDEMNAEMERLLTQQDRQSVIAPIDGEVLMLYRGIGSYVTAGTPIALIGNFRVLYFTISLEDFIAKRLFVGQEMSLDFKHQDLQKIYNTEYEAGNESDSLVSAFVEEISPPLDRKAAIRTVKLRVDNSYGLLEPKVYHGVTLCAKANQTLLTAPLSAMANSTRTQTFVVKSDGTLERRTIAVGADDGQYVEIISGLSEGEVVVTSGMSGLEDGMKAEITMREDS